MLYGYIPCYDADRPETPEPVDRHVFDHVVNDTTRQIYFDDDGAFIVKMNGVTCERDLTDEQWDNIETLVLEHIASWHIPS